MWHAQSNSSHSIVGTRSLQPKTSHENQFLHAQNDEGAYEPILPPAELEVIYRRILANELVVEDSPGLAGGSAGGGAPPGSGRPRRPSRLQGKRLAAAMGMTQLTLPFR